MEPHEPNPHARNTDPATSHEAVPGNITDQMFLALRAYRGGNSMTDHDACRICNRDIHQRCSDLRMIGFIVPTGERGITPYGKSAQKCRITEAGRMFIKFMEARLLE